VDRESKKHSFSDTPTETYTFIPTGSPDGLIFAYTNLDAAYPVIQSISQNENEVTVTFYPGLDEAAAGLTRAEALKAELYAVFTSSDTQQQLTLTLSVSDCQCCPGLFIPGGEYSDIARTSTLPPGSFDNPYNNTDGRAAYALLSSLDVNGFANNKTGNGLCYYYRDANISGASSAAPTAYTWHNASGSSSATAPYNNGKGVCQTVEGIDAADAHADWRLPNLGELAQIGQLVSNNTPGAINAGIGSQAEVSKAINGGTGYIPHGFLPTGTTTANGTYNIADSTYYWSSTERDDTYAWLWVYYSANPRRAGYITKAGTYYVRCVRKF
jgi:uncharacterized protein (TIGR02145 family)